MTHKEPDIVINGKRLTSSQAMAIRVGLESFYSDLEENGLGDDEHGRQMVILYMQRIREIRQIMQQSFTQTSC